MLEKHGHLARIDLQEAKKLAASLWAIFCLYAQHSTCYQLTVLVCLAATTYCAFVSVKVRKTIGF
jgi:hypothetical protein